MASKIHELKIMPKYFDEVIKGSKTFEIRRNDRDFEVGDRLLLREHTGRGYTGCNVRVLVTYVLKDFEGVKDGFCVMGIKVEKIKI